MNFLISSSPRKVIDCPHVPQTFSSFNSSMSPPVEERHYLILAKDLLPLGNFNTPPSINWPYQTTQYKVMPFSIYCITPPPTTWPIGHTWPFGHTYAYTHIYASTTTDVIFEPHHQPPAQKGDESSVGNLAAKRIKQTTFPLTIIPKLQKAPL